MEKIAAGELAYTSEVPSAAEEDERLTGTEAKIALAQKEAGRHKEGAGVAQGQGAGEKRSRVRTDVPIPAPPFWGTRVVDDVPLDEVFAFVNEVALIRGQWQVRKGKMKEEEYRKLLEEKIYPEFADLKEKIKRERLLQPRVVYGYFPCQSEEDDLIIYQDDLKSERLRFTFPRQTDDRFLCLSDYFSSVRSGRWMLLPSSW